MEDKLIELSHVYYSMKRTECLIEELLWRQILHNSESLEKATEEFNNAMANVSSAIKESLETLPPSKES